MSTARRIVTWKMEGTGLTWGSDSLLGIGTGITGDSSMITLLKPLTNLIPVDTTITLPGGGPSVKLMPLLSENASLGVWIETHKILIRAQSFGAFLPDVAPLDGHRLPITSVISALNKMLVLAPEYLIEPHGLPVTGAASVKSGLEAQRDALTQIQAQTIQRINQAENIDTIAATLALPAPLINPPAVQPPTTSVAGAVRAGYQAQMGWFDGDPVSLFSLSRQEQMRRFVPTMGPSQAITAARRGLEEQTQEGGAWSFGIAQALMATYPSADATKVYREALRRLAFSEQSFQQRNFYLSEYYLAEQMQ